MRYKTMTLKNCIYQFKISLKEITPIVWRRIQVPTNYNFWDLHVAIQNSMGWLDYHLHQFSIKRPHAHKFTEIGIPDEEEFFDDIEILPGWYVDVSSYFTDLGVLANYKYDFGDGWEHGILLEGLLIKEKGTKYPQCVEGERKCPPEDCGGVPGYFDFLEAVLNPMHEEHKRMIAWYGSKYDPDDFDPKKVRFDNPKKRWKIAFLDHQ
jgi:hypothetical protein